MLKMKELLVLIAIVFSLQINAQTSGYKVPSKEIADLIDAPLPPEVSINATKDWMLLMDRPSYPSIEELAQPELRIAGIRINPRTNGASRSSGYTGFTLKNMTTRKDFVVTGLPENANMENVAWSANGKKFAFTMTKPDGLELWVAEVDNAQAKRLGAVWVNDAMGGNPFSWMPDNEHLLVKCILKDRVEVPQQPLTPEGPVIQESKGQETTLRTYQDLLKNPYDEELFEYYASAQVMKIHSGNGTMMPFGTPGIVDELSVSPDGNYVLLSVINRPFSYLVPFYNFPTTYMVFDPSGNKVKDIAAIPLTVNLPKGFGAVREGPRDINWRTDQPSTLYWVEAQDGGDPKTVTDVRDQLFYLKAPFDGEKIGDVTFKLRFSRITWGNDHLAIAYESWWSSRSYLISQFTPGVPASKKVLYDLSFDDAYNNPGNFVTTPNGSGSLVLLTNKEGKKLYLTGQGASTEGDRPFLRALDLATGKTEELWRSEAPYYETPVTLLDLEKNLVITRRESVEEPPNYFIRNWKSGKMDALTAFPHPYPSLKGIEKQVVQYQRNDGVELSGDLYLPKGFVAGKSDPLPVLMWAYPREFKSASDAGQISGSPYQFIRVSSGSPIFWVAKGYAVFDRAAMPIVGEGDEEPNDSFKEQLVANAEAAINKLVDMKVADRNRIGVGGHSYGAFMTANLLAHCDLFAAGIARSGAYNRTLTPFGFQREERTYWDAPEVYYTMSPFMHADKIKEPILMIHGEADNNSGTFPIQSERMYAAINGLGGKARLVMLPHESHGYRARESILHMLYEMDVWMEKYVKRREVKP